MTTHYEQAKHLAQHGTWEERAALAADENLPAELQVFLAADNSETVRLALAQNNKVPMAAVRLLARDAMLSVRQTIGAHVARLWPERLQQEPSRMRDLAREALLQLTTDAALAVRAALATAIADVLAAPPEVAEALALDAAQEVATPILRHYAGLDDNFLIDVLSQRSESWARVALAERMTISVQLSDALVATNDAAALTSLLGNTGAVISQASFDSITEKASTEPQWQPLLVTRQDLPQPSAVRLAEFIDHTLYNVLAARSDLDAETLREIVGVARRRIDWVESGKLPAILRVREMLDQGTLNDDAIRDALAWRDDEFVQLALAVLSHVPPPLVAQIMGSTNPKAVTALSWRAGLAARTALALQKGINGLAPHQYLHPRGGTEYPLSEAELLWQLEFYGVKI